MIRLRDKLTPASRIRYLMWRSGLFGRELEVQLVSGERLIFSGFPYELHLAYEIFVSEAYRCPRPVEIPSVGRIVDVGSNVGYSVVYWGSHFPQAHIDAFEPHPAHLAKLRQSLDLNGLNDRVTVNAAAAGTSKGRASLTDAGAISTIVFDSDPRKPLEKRVIRIEIVDFFEAVGNGRIDLLKLDCEGTEYDLLMDPRFENLNVRCLVMEWHETSGHPRAELDLTGRLSELGWELHTGMSMPPPPIEGLDLLRLGLVWGFAKSPEKHH